MDCPARCSGRARKCCHRIARPFVKVSPRLLRHARNREADIANNSVTVPHQGNFLWIEASLHFGSAASVPRLAGRSFSPSLTKSRVRRVCARFGRQARQEETITRGVFS
jgi:hypothetical protein